MLQLQIPERLLRFRQVQQLAVLDLALIWHHPRLLAELRRRLAGLIYTTERSLAESANYLTESELAQIRVDLEEGRRATESADMARMANALTELEKSAFRITEVMYKDLA